VSDKQQSLANTRPGSLFFPKRAKRAKPKKACSQSKAWAPAQVFYFPAKTYQKGSLRMSIEKRKLRQIIPPSNQKPVTKINELPETIFDAHIASSFRSQQKIVSGVGLHNGETVGFTIPLAKITVPYTIDENGSIRFQREAKV
jgi:hypothetical protein